jgi:hypothetical protein
MPSVKRKRGGIVETSQELPKPEKAQHTTVHSHESFLSKKAANLLVDQIWDLHLRPCTNNSDQDYFAGEPVHVTSYLHEDGIFMRDFALLRAQVLALARTANQKQHWGLDLSNAKVRCAEFHRYLPPAGLPVVPPSKSHLYISCGLKSHIRP